MAISSRGRPARRRAISRTFARREAVPLTREEVLTSSASRVMPTILYEAPVPGYCPARAVWATGGILTQSSATCGGGAHPVPGSVAFSSALERPDRFRLRDDVRLRCIEHVLDARAARHARQAELRNVEG